MSEHESPIIAPQDFEQYLQRFPIESSIVTLEQYTPENLKYAMHADALSLVVMMILARWKSKYSDKNLPLVDLHRVLNAMQVEPLDVVLEKVSERKSSPMPTDSNSYWTVSLARVGEIRRELDQSEFFSDQKNSLVVFAIAGNFLSFWKNHDTPISPRALLPRKSGIEDRLRALKVISNLESVSLRSLEKTAGIPFGYFHQVYLPTFEESGILESTALEDIAYSVVPELEPDLINKIFSEAKSPSFARMVWKQINQLSSGYHTLQELLGALKGNTPDLRRTLYYFANNPFGQILNRKNPGVSFSPVHKGALESFVELVDHSIHPHRKFIIEGFSKGTFLVNDPEFIHGFLLQARKEMQEYEVHQATKADASTRRREIGEIVSQPVEGEALYQLPAGISETTFQFMKFAEEKVRIAGIPKNRKGEPVISDELYSALYQLILGGVSLNALNLGTSNWNTKKKLIQNALKQLAKAFYVPKDQHSRILEFFTDDAASVRRVRHNSGDTTILSSAKLSELRRREGAVAANERRQIEQENDRILALLTPETITQYIQAIQEIPPIDKAKEQHLITRTRQGDREAREQLLLAYLRQVVEIAKQHLGKGVDLVDLVGEGNVVLTELIFSLSAEDVDLEEQITLEVNKSLRKMYSGRRWDRSIAEPVYEGGSTIGDMLVDNSSSRPDQLAERKEFWMGVQHLLTEEERNMLVLRYGLDGGPGLERAQIARIEDMDIEEVKAIEQRALKKLRDSKLLAQ